MKKIERLIKISIIFAGIFAVLALALICYLGINEISFGRILDPILYIAVFIPTIICIILPFIIVKLNEKMINEMKMWQIKEFQIQKDLNLVSYVSQEYEHIYVDDTCFINFKKNKKIYSYIVCIKAGDIPFKEEELYDKMNGTMMAEAPLLGSHRVIYILQDMDLSIVDSLLNRNICPQMNSDFITFAYYESGTGCLKINQTKLKKIDTEKIINDMLDDFFTYSREKSNDL